MRQKLTKEEKRQKKALRSYRGRFFKNLFIWLLGFIFGFISIFAGIAVAVGVVPLEKYLGKDSDKYVSQDISKKTLLQAIMSFNQYGMSDIPVLEDVIRKLVEETPVKDFVEVDFEKLNTIKFGGANFTNDLKNCFTITATLNSVGGAGVLGDLGKLSIFSTYDLVTETVDPTANNFNAKLYYYKDGENFARAFTNDGKYVAGVDEGTPLYYPNLSEVPLLDAKDMITASFARLDIINLMNVAGAGVGNTGLIYNILNGKKISDLGSLSADSILLSDVLPKEGNTNLYDILEGLFGINDTSSVGSLGQISINKDMVVLDMLSSLNVTLDSSSPLYTILNGKTIDNLTNLGVDEIRLTDILPEANYDNLYDILEGVFEIDRENATIGSLGSIKIENSMVVLDILSAFDVTLSEDSPLYTILDGKTIGELSNLEINDLLLTGILPEKDYGNLYDILEKLFDIDRKTATIGSLGKIKLDDTMVVLDMLEAFDVEIKEGSVVHTLLDGKTLGELADLDTDSILENVDFDNMLLSEVLPPEDNAELYDLLFDIFGLEAESVKIVDLSKNLTVKENLKVLDMLEFFNVTISESSAIYNIVKDKTVNELASLEEKDILLTDVLDSTQNAKLYNILEKLFGIKKENATLESLGKLTINNTAEVLDLLDVLDVNIDQSSVIHKILDGKTIDDLSSMDINDIIDSIDIDDVLLTDVLDPDENAKLYEILDKLFGVKQATAKLSDLKGLQMLDDTPVLDMLNVFDVHIASTNVLYDVLNGKTVDDLSSMDINDIIGSIDIDDVLLSDVLSPEDNAELYEILEGIFGIDQLTAKVSDLKGLQVQDTMPVLDMLAVFDIDIDSDSVIYKILNNKTIGNMSSIEIGDMLLSDLLVPSENEKLYEILQTLFNVDQATAKVSALGSLEINQEVGILNMLSTFDVTIEEGTIAYKLLNGKKLSELKNISVDSLTLGDVLSESSNDKIYSILNQAVELAEGYASVADMPLSIINANFNIGNVRLGLVLSEDTNGSLYSILNESITVPAGYKDANGNATNKVSDMKLSDINANFSIDNVTLGTALNEDNNPELYAILEEALVLPDGTTSIAQLKLSQLDACFTVENICLDTLLEDVTVDNGILKALKGKGIKIKDLGAELENLKISEIYEINCFTTVDTGSARYSKVGEDYVLDSNGLYYVSNDAGIWLFFLYDVEKVGTDFYDANGNAKKYVEANLTLGDMQNGVSDVAGEVMNATVRELVNAGIINDTNFNNPLIYTMTMSQVIEKIGNPTGA